MDSINSEILGAMNIKSYSLRRPSLIKNTDKGLLYADVLRSFPYFVFVGDDNYNREWVFNLVGYLRYLSYPCGWFGRESAGAENILTICPASMPQLPDGRDPDIPIYPGESGKRNLWSVIRKYVREVEKMKVVRAPVDNPSFILETPDKCKWIFNLAGFLDYNEITYSWNRSEASDKTVVISLDADESGHNVRITGEGEQEQKRAVFSALLSRGYLVSASGKISLGNHFADNTDADKEN